MSRYAKRILAVVAVVLAFVALTSIARRISTVQRLEGEYATATAAYARIEATRAYLQTQVARATEGVDFDERVREQLGMAREGDQVIAPVPVGTPQPQVHQQSEARQSTPTPPPPPWEVWWRLFFGPLE